MDDRGLFIFFGRRGPDCRRTKANNPLNPLQLIRWQPSCLSYTDGDYNNGFFRCNRLIDTIKNLMLVHGLVKSSFRACIKSPGVPT